MSRRVFFCGGVEQPGIHPSFLGKAHWVRIVQQIRQEAVHFYGWLMFLCGSQKTTRVSNKSLKSKPMVRKIQPNRRWDGMERYKWFDFLGALLLLFSVTKSALTPQGSADSSSHASILSNSVSHDEVSFFYASEETSHLLVEWSNPTAKPLLDRGSNSSGLSHQVGGDVSGLHAGKDLHQARKPALMSTSGERMESLDPLADTSISQTRPSTTSPVFIW